MQNRFKMVSVALVAGLVVTPAALAQSNELSFLAGAGNPSASVNVGSMASVTAGVSASVQAGFAHRIKDTPSGSLYIELPLARVFKASVDVGWDHVNAAQSQLFFTPGLRYKFVPQLRVSPYVVGGFGFGWFDAANVSVTGPVSVSVLEGFKPAAGFGAGAEVRIAKSFDFRAEVRDFVNCGGNAPSRNHVVYSGGFGFRF